MIRLLELRKSRKLTQSELAHKLDLTQQAYARYENCQRQPDFDTLIRIANYFNVSIDYLLGRTEDRQNKPIYNVLSSKKEENELSLSQSEKALILALRRSKKGEELIRAVLLMIGETRTIEEILKMA